MVGGGFKPLANTEINDIMRKYKITNFRGCYSKDILPASPLKNESVVVNLEDYLDGNGTHWTVIYNDPKSRDIEYFDSFGMLPPDVVRKYMSKANKGIVYNSSTIQDMNSIMCGYYCVYFIIQRHQGRPMNEILLDFTLEPSLFNEWSISSFSKTV